MGLSIEDLHRLQSEGKIKGFKVSAGGVAANRKPKDRKPAGEYGTEPLVIAQKIKPLSVNEAWKGRRFKTQAHKNYEKHLLAVLPEGKAPAPPYSIYFEFGLSNQAADGDNPVKNLQDIAATKYGFNDKLIYEWHIVKRIVPVGEEYFIIRLTTIKNNP